MTTHEAISKVQGQLAAMGVAKNQTNEHQNYSFRGIDDICNALAPLLADSGLVIAPSVLERSVIEKPTRHGGTLFYVCLRILYTLSMNHEDKIEVTVFGEAMDSGDKATNKAMSAAYKYMCLQTFCIPTEGDDDPDASTPDEVLYQPRTPPNIDLPTPDLNACSVTEEELCSIGRPTTSDKIYQAYLAVFDKYHHEKQSQEKITRAYNGHSQLLEQQR